MIHIHYNSSVFHEKTNEISRFGILLNGVPFFIFKFNSPSTQPHESLMYFITQSVIHNPTV